MTGNSTEQEGARSGGSQSTRFRLVATEPRAVGLKVLGRWERTYPDFSLDGGDSEIRNDQLRASRVSYDIVRPFHPFQIAVETDETDALRMSMGKRTNAFRNRT